MEIVGAAGMIKIAARHVDVTKISKGTMVIPTKATKYCNYITSAL